MDLSKISYLQLSVSDIALKPQLDSLPVLLCGLTDKTAATEAKEYLSGFFAPDTPVFLYFKTEKHDKSQKNEKQDNSVKPEKTYETVLKMLDSDAVCAVLGADCRALVVPDRGFDKKIYTFGDLIRILERLTGEDGCPWDKKQTHESIRSNMIEEAYEAALAIGSGDQANLIEELGDVMLQSVFHADIAKRGGEFDLSDIITTLCRKLYTRHTHIFGDKKAEDSTEALKNWEAAKAAEKGGEAGMKSYAGLPSLMRAQKIYSKYKAQIKQTSEIKDINFDSESFGQALFLLAAKGGDLGIDAESELNAYLNKITKNN